MMYYGKHTMHKTLHISNFPSETPLLQATGRALCMMSKSIFLAYMEFINYAQGVESILNRV